MSSQENQIPTKTKVIKEYSSERKHEEGSSETVLKKGRTQDAKEAQILEQLKLFLNYAGIRLFISMLL